jgi:hypothetical protein
MNIFETQAPVLRMWGFIKQGLLLGLISLFALHTGGLFPKYQFPQLADIRNFSIRSIIF